MPYHTHPILMPLLCCALKDQCRKLNCNFHVRLALVLFVYTTLFFFNKKHPLAGEACVCPACARRHAGVHEWRLQPNSVTSRLTFLCFVLSVIFEWFTMRWNARLFFNRFCRPLLQEVVAVFHLVTVSLTEVSRAALFLACALAPDFLL